MRKKETSIKQLVTANINPEKTVSTDLYKGLMLNFLLYFHDESIFLGLLSINELSGGRLLTYVVFFTSFSKDFSKC